MAYSERGLHGQVVHALGKRIVTGALEPDHTFDLAALEHELGVSRTVIREALKVLAAKGLVDSRQKRGTFVRSREDWSLLDTDVLRWQFDGSDRQQLLDQLAEVRAIVEPAGARLAAERRTDDDLEALAAALDAMAEAAEDRHATVEADLHFHRVLLAAAHNELLARMEMVIEPALAERDRLVHAGPAKDPLPTHRAVYEAVEAGDPEGAEQAMMALLTQAESDIEEHGTLPRSPRRTRS